MVKERRRHYLTPIVRKSVFGPFVAVDTETLNEHGKREAGRHRLQFGVAIRVQGNAEVDRLLFRTTEEFWDWCLGPKKSLVVYAHNWNFDAAILDLDTLIDRGFSTTAYINDGTPPVIIEFTKGRLKIRFVDTLNYFRMSLKGLGDAVGLEKLEMPEDVDSVDVMTYAWRDVEIVKESVLSLRTFVKTNGFDYLPDTIASLAFSIWRNAFSDSNVLVHVNAKALELERDAYKGGRTDCFYKGKTPEMLYYFDVNSMYPYIMREMPLPVSLEYVFDSYYPNAFDRAFQAGKAVFARCLLDTDKEAYGVRHEGRLVFPVGEFVTTLTNVELKYALANDHVKEVYGFSVYNTAHVFTDYVNKMYTLRQEYKRQGNAGYDFFCKLLLNSLYGKFGQRSYEWVEMPDLFIREDGWYSDETLGLIQVRRRLGMVEGRIPRGEGYNSAPSIAAEITGGGRMMLWNLIEKVRAANGKVYYCDTDSVMVCARGAAALTELVGPSLGQLKLEAESDDAVFYAPKDYTFGGKTKIKGIRHAEAEKRDYKQERFTSFNVHLGRKDRGFVDIIIQDKHVTGNNLKRRGDKGWTEPIRMVYNAST